MHSNNGPKPAYALPDLLSWEHWALQSFKMKLTLGVIIVVSIQVLALILWLHHRSLPQEHAVISQSEILNASEYQTAITLISQVQDGDEWSRPVTNDSLLSPDVWMDMEFMAERLGLAVLEPKKSLVLAAPQLSDPNPTWTVSGTFSACLQWITEVSVEYPWVITSLSLDSAGNKDQVMLKVSWRMPAQDLNLSPSPAPTINTMLRSLEHGGANLASLPESYTVPSFVGLEMPMGSSSMSTPWPETWSREWQDERRHYFPHTALEKIQWKGALMGIGQAVALVEAEAELATVERGDIIGQGRYRVVRIAIDHMLIQQSMHDQQGRIVLKEWVLGNVANRQIP